jgi:hypothetical protein
MMHDGKWQDIERYLIYLEINSSSRILVVIVNGKTREDIERYLVYLEYDWPESTRLHKTGLNPWATAESMGNGTHGQRRNPWATAESMVQNEHRACALVSLEMV